MGLHLPHQCVRELVIDSDVQHIVLVGLDQGTREYTVDSHGGSTEPIWRKVGVNDIKVVVDIGRKDGREQSELSEKLERSRKGYHGCDLT